jgi:NADP-dependent 3-hydroxy acid dehydrogenase YdfG
MAVEFGKLGAKLTLCDINEKGLEETKALMLANKSIKEENILLVQLDVSNRDAITEASKNCVKKFGEVDILINNAGIVQGKLISELDENFASKSYKVNFESHLWLIREFIEAMKKKNTG